MNPVPGPPMMGGPGLQEAPGATAGLVLGILSILFAGPIGLILGYIGFNKSKEAKKICEMNPGMFSNAGVAQAGYICSIVGLSLGVVFSLCFCGYFIMIFAVIGVGAAGGP